MSEKKQEVKSEQMDGEHRTLQFGEGRIGVHAIKLRYSDKPEEMALMFRPGQSKRPVGSATDVPPGNGIEFQEDDVVLHFSNWESIDVVVEQLIKLRDEMTKPESANA